MKKKFTILVLLAVLGLSGLVQAQIPTDSLVGYWPFNGNANDESGNGNDGTVNGATLTTDRFGNANSAYSFDGSDDYIVVTANNFLQTSNFTVSCWIKANRLDGHNTFFSTMDLNQGPLSDYELRVWESYIQNAKGNGVSFGGLSSQSTIDTIAWYHCVSIYRNDTFYLVINNIYEDTVANGFFANNFDLYFGTRNTDGLFYKGILDDIRIYNKALSYEEITSLYEEGLCSDTLISDTIIHYVSNIEFQYESPKTYFESTDSLTTQIGGCDSIIHHYSKYVFDANHCTDTTEVFDTTYVTVYDSISVTDTLIIDVVLTGIAPPNNVNTVKVYPNPANDYVVINTGDYGQMTGYNMQIVNPLGQTVFENLIDQAEFQINVNDFGGYGTYFIKIFDDQGTLLDTRKLILQ